MNRLLEIVGADNPQQLLDANSRICAAVFDGDLSPEQGQALSNLLGNQRKLIELLEFEKRLVNVEKAMKDKHLISQKS